MCSRRQFLSDITALVEVNPVQVVDVVLEWETFAERCLISSFTYALLKKVNSLGLKERISIF